MLKKLFIIITCFASHMAHAQDVAQLVKKDGKKELFKINGAISVGSWFYNASGIEQRRVPISWFITGAPTISIAGFAMPFSATISEQERSFQQPFNQIGVSPYYKWAKLHLGYRNLSFGEYTLAGASFLGAGMELNPKKIRFGAFYGRLRRAVDEDTTLNFTVTPSYKRMAMGAKLGIGSAYNFVDLSFLKSNDEIGSANIDSFGFIKPQDNFVFSLKNQWRVGKKITFGTEGALSLLTYNKLLGEIIVDSSLGNDAAKFSFVNNLVQINLSTKARLAGNGFINFQADHFSIRFDSRYTQAEFLSHGANFVQDDIFINTISPTFSLFKEKINVSTSFGIQTDNLDKTKEATTERLVSSASVSFRPIKRSMVALSYSNFGTSQASGNVQLNDSVLMSVVNTSYGAVVSYQIPSKTKSHSISINTQKSDVLDRNEFTRQFSQSNVFFGGINYSLGFNKIMANISTGLNYSNVNTFGADINAIGGNLTLSKNLKKNTIRLSSSFGYQNRYIGGKSNGYIANNNTNINYNFKKKHNFGFGLTFTKNTSTVQSIRAFNEQRIRLNYGFSF